MRARLLDLGEVGPVRSQSAYHAVLAGISPDDDPVVFLVRPAGTLISIGQPPSRGDDQGNETPREEIDLQACLDRGVPLVRRRIGGPPGVLGENDLLIQLILPSEKTSSTAVSSASEPVLRTLTDLGIDARASNGEHGGFETAAGRIGHLQAGVVGSAVCIAYCLTWKERPSAISSSRASSVAAQLEGPPTLADLAERLLTAIEDHFSLDLFPSLPTPAELAAIYEWDRRLLIETVEEASITETVTAVLQ